MNNLQVQKRGIQKVTTEYLPSSEEEKDEKQKFVANESVGLEVERRLFVCESTNLWIWLSK